MPSRSIFTAPTDVGINPDSTMLQPSHTTRSGIPQLRSWWLKDLLQKVAVLENDSSILKVSGWYGLMSSMLFGEKVRFFNAAGLWRSIQKGFPLTGKMLIHRTCNGTEPNTYLQAQHFSATKPTKSMFGTAIHAGQTFEQKPPSSQLFFSFTLLA